MSKIITLIVPIYKEKEGLSNLISNLNDIKSSLSFDVIFVDDGNENQIVIDKYKPQFKFQIIRNEYNSGYGFSIKKGISNSNSEICAIIDADNSYKVEDFVVISEKFLESNRDMIVGKRNFSYKESFPRKIFRNFINSFSSAIFNFNIKDINSGLRIFYKKDFENLKKFFPDQFSLTSTQTLTYIMENKKIEYCDITYDKRSGSSKINIFKDPFNFIFLILKILLIYKPIKFFGYLGVFFILTSVLIFLISLFLFEKFFDTTFLVLFIFGLNCIFLGLLGEIINLKKK